MVIGRLPGLALDRTGIAVSGAIGILIVTGATPSEAADFIDFSTLSLLFGLMVVSAQFRLAGAYTWLAARMATVRAGPSAFLLLVILVSGGLSAVLANDIIVLAMAPVLIGIVRDRRLNPVPYLIGLAAGANAGSAATLIGNPQNILIGQTLQMSFARYLFLDALLPSTLALIVSWLVIRRVFRKRLARSVENSPAAADPGDAPAFDRFQAWKGAAVVMGLAVVFIGGWWDRDLVALAAAGLLLTNRRLTSPRFLSLIDWNLLALFAALFVINGALAGTGAFESAADAFNLAGVDIASPAWLFAASAVLSNLVSNVPATMILLPYASHEAAGAVLALSSTLAGNLVIVGSIANIIMVEQAARAGVTVTWRTHAAAGIPITLATLLLAAAWLLVRYL